MKRLFKIPLWFRFSLAVAVPLMAGDAGAAANADSEPTPPPALKSRFYNQQTPHAGEVTRGIITAATNQFSFVIPQGFKRLAEINGKTLVLNSTNMTATITLKIFEEAVDGRADLKPESLKQAALARFKDCRIVDEFPGSIESWTGPVFEIEWPGPVCRMSTRLGFIPYAGGHVEVLVQSPSAEFRSYDAALASFLMTIRTSPVGIKVPVIEYLSEL